MFDGIKDKLRGMALGAIAKRIESGDFGPTVQRVYIATKGYVTVTSAIVLIAASAAAYYANSDAATLIAQISLVGVGLGLIRHGVDIKAPEAIPVDLRNLLELGLSWLTLVGNGAQLLVVSCQGIGEPWALAISGKAQVTAFCLSSITGFLSTLLHDPKSLTGPR